MGSVRRGGRSFFGFYAFNEKSDGQADQADHAQVAKVVNVGVDGRLNVQAIGNRC